MTLEHDIQIIKEIVDLGWLTKREAVVMINTVVNDLLRKYDLL